MTSGCRFSAIAEVMIPKSRPFQFHTSVTLNDAKICKFCDRTTGIQFALPPGTAHVTMAGIKRKQAPVKKINGKNQEA